MHNILESRNALAEYCTDSLIVPGHEGNKSFLVKGQELLKFTMAMQNINAPYFYLILSTHLLTSTNFTMHNELEFFCGKKIYLNWTIYMNVPHTNYDQFAL